MEQGTFFTVAVLGLLSLGGLVIYLCVYHKCRLWSEKDKVNKARLEQQLAFTKKILEVQESERKRIAKDLHDDLGALAIQLKLNNNDLGKGLTSKDELLTIAKKNDALANEIIRTGRSVAHDLLPHTLEKKGFIEGVRELSGELNRPGKFLIGLNCEVEYVDFDKTAQISLYRVLKEWLNNVIQHSKASELQLAIKKQEDLLCIQLIDNGIPFCFESARKSSNGLGLMNIEGRLNQLNAKFSFDHIQSTGNIFKIEYPLKLVNG